MSQAVATNRFRSFLNSLVQWFDSDNGAAEIAQLKDNLAIFRDTISTGTHARFVVDKAKTAERLGPVGQGQSIEARAVVLLAG